MEICLTYSDFLSCELYRIKKTPVYENVPGFGLSLQKLKQKLVLLCGNEDCEEEIVFTFWDSTGVNSYECDVCGSTTRFEDTVPIKAFLDLL